MRRSKRSVRSGGVDEFRWVGEDITRPVAPLPPSKHPLESHRNTLLLPLFVALLYFVPKGPWRRNDRPGPKSV